MAERGQIGRRLRGLIGVDEALLAEVPSDRARYTRLGGIVVGTAAIASISMYVGIGEVFGAPTLLALIPALLWGVFIANLDAWLIASLHGTRWRQHFWVVFPRLFVAIFFGFLIAEPLVLKAFEPAIEREIGDSRQDDVLRFQTHLRECNPVRGTLSSKQAEACKGAVLVVRGIPSPGAIESQLRGFRAERSRLQKSVDKSAATQRKLDDVARLECNGGDGRGLTGRYGVGPSCRRNRQDADNFRRTSRRDEQTAQIVSLTRRITRLERRLKDNSQDYEAGLNAAIAERVAERKARQKEMGLLERLYAMKALVKTNFYLAAAEWFLRLLFIMIDCLPLLVKLSGGSTSYDKVLDLHLASAERTYAAQARTEEKRMTTAQEYEQYELERTLQSRRENLDSEVRLATARRDIEVDAAIDEFEEMLRRQDRAAEPEPEAAGSNGRFS